MNNGTNNAGNKKNGASQAIVAPTDDNVNASQPPELHAKRAPFPKEGVDANALTLLAVFQAHSPLASAVINTQGQGAHRYNVGETLPKGGMLTAIRPTEVVIRDNGRQITLHMALMRRQNQNGTGNDDEPASTDDRPQMPWQVVDFLSKMDLTPVSEHSPRGYRVGEDFPKSGTEEVGVKPGDTIVAVNGYPVGEYHSDYLVWLSFKDRYRASVLVRTEEGEEFTFHFPDDVKGARN